MWRVVYKPKGKNKMSKKKDPNIVLRDKRLRDVARRYKNTVKETSMFGCQFLDRMVDENYELAERVVKLEHFLWKVEVKDGVVVLAAFTDAANALAKKDRDLLVRQYKYMMGYKDTLEQRIDRVVYDRTVPERKETKRLKPEGK